MAAISGRKTRIKYSSDGSNYIVVAGARTDGLTISNEKIDITDKDDLGVQTLLDDIGTQSFAMNVEGVLKDDILLDLAISAGDGTALHDFEILITGIGTLTGDWFIEGFEVSGAEGAEATTFTCSLASSGSPTYAAA